MVDVFTWNFKEITRKYLSCGSRQGDTGKRLYFPPHCRDETTTYSTRALQKAASQKTDWCFLKSQRHNQRNAPAIKPQKGKMGEKSCIFYALKLKQPHPMTEPKKWLCLSLWLIQDSNWKGRVLWKVSGGLATILQNWISCNEQKMREAHITRRGTNFYLLIFIEKNHQP